MSTADTMTQDVPLLFLSKLSHPIIEPSVIFDKGIIRVNLPEHKVTKPPTRDNVVESTPCTSDQSIL